MKVNFWLTINSSGSVRTTKGQPTNLSWNEVSVQMNLQLPDALFTKPKLVADIVIPDEAAISDTLNAEVVDNVKKAIAQTTGLDFRISIVEPETEIS